MSIAEAIQRAKADRQAQQRAAAANASVEGAAAPAATTTKFRQSTDTQQHSPDSSGRRAPQAELPVFRRIAYSVDDCIQARILVPENAAQKNAGASSAYRMLRTRLLQKANAAGWSAIAITSPGPGEGKSVTATNLALTIARDKSHPVFLLDLDFRNPSICRYFGIQPERDLTQFFDGTASAEEVMFSIGVDNLVVAGNSSSNPNSSELVASDGLQLLLSQIAAWAPDALVIIDLPPVLSTDEALQVAPKVSTTILVVSEGKTRREGVAKAMNVLSEFNVAGVILNRANDVVSDYYSS
jgi:capsular exopolysaccharide synthesis family protein